MSEEKAILISEPEFTQIKVVRKLLKFVETMDSSVRLRKAIH